MGVKISIARRLFVNGRNDDLGQLLHKTDILSTSFKYPETSRGKAATKQCSMLDPRCSMLDTDKGSSVQHRASS
ncbi:MAG: hypothetical protein AB1797_00835 [bacterium]